MRTRPTSATIALACAGIFLASTVTAAKPSPADCRQIDDEQRRLACYDRLHRPSSGPAPESSAPDAPPPPAPRQAPADGFGKEHLPAPAPRPPREAAEPEASDDLVAEVTASGEGITEKHWFRLDNGQLWQQVTARPTTVETGDAVRITRSRIGTYHLRRADGGSRSTQVKRME